MARDPNLPITPAMEKRILKMIETAPPGSDIDKAKKAGVDLYRLVENLKLTPAERLRRAFEAVERRRLARERRRKAKLKEQGQAGKRR